MTDTSEQLAQAIQALKNSYSDDFGYSELLTEDVVIAWSAWTHRQIDPEVVARVQKQVEYVETHSLVIPCVLSLSDVNAMLEALA